MKLRTVHVHNFRGVLDQEISLKGYSLLVGANNSGKSTVIDAIRAFYEKDGFKFKPDNDFPYGTTSDQESWVELSFTLTDEEFESLADVYRTPSSTELRVRKYFKTDTKMHDGKPAAGFIFGYKADGSLSDESFYGAKNVQSGKFGDLVYIPAISKVDEHAKLSGPSALRDLLNDIMSDVVKSGEAYGEFKAGVQTFSESIRHEETSDGRSLSGFEAELNSLLVSWQTNFTLKFPPPPAADIVRSMLKWDLIDQVHGREQDIESFGSGFQRHFIYALIQVGSRYVSSKRKTKAKDFTPELTLILFEEPEAFLHPPQQEELARNLKALAGKENWQVLCATHSAHFVSKNAEDIPAIIRLSRSDAEVKTFQISGNDWDSIIDANQSINAIAGKYPKMAKRLQEDDLRPDMEAVKYFIWLNTDRSSAFFAEHVLLVEGPTEVALISKLISDGRIRNAHPGLHVMDCIGKYNIHRFMNLCIHMGLPHSVIHDDDRNRDEHIEINQLIEDSKDPDLTLAIRPIPGELGEMLGLPAPGGDHRKPQHTLYLYETGKIDEEKLRAFCKLVEECLPADIATTSKQSAESGQAP